MRLGRIKGKNTLALALKHNKRMLVKDYPNIDPEKTNQNYTLLDRGDVPDVIQYIKQKKLDAGICKDRKNGVLAIEIVFSLPLDYETLNIDGDCFFADCFNWTMREFNMPVLAFDVHKDEGAHHAHAIVLPLVHGKMVGSEVIGYLGKNNMRIQSFIQDVGSKYGLSSSANNKTQKSVLASKVIDRLKSDFAFRSLVWQCIRQSVELKPEPYAQLLNLN